MEYLMTYGWAILIIAVVLGALFQLGVFNSSSFSPRAPPGACQVFRPSGPGTTTNINLMGVCTGVLPQYVGVFNGQNSYVATATSFSANTATSGYTISAWIYQTSTDGYNWQGIAGIGMSTVTLAIEVHGGNRLGAWGCGNQGATPTVQNLLNNWHQVAGVFYQNAGFISAQMYYDGQYVGNSITDRAVPCAASRTFQVAQTYGGYSTWFHGSIANVQLYNSSLDGNQIQALYLKGIGGAPSPLQNLMVWWPLNGNSNDYSGNNNNGVPTSVTFTSQYGK